MSIESKGQDWRHSAKCQDEDPELFFPIGNTGPIALRQIEEARAVCNKCEVIYECLKWAMETGQEAGVWGGMSEDERKSLKRRKNWAKTIGKESTKDANKWPKYTRDSDF